MTAKKDEIVLNPYGENPRQCGVGDEVVISDRNYSLFVTRITGLTKTTVKTEKGTYSRKSLREYGAGDSWHCS